MKIHSQKQTVQGSLTPEELYLMFIDSSKLASLGLRMTATPPMHVEARKLVSQCAFHRVYLPSLSFISCS